MNNQKITVTFSFLTGLFAAIFIVITFFSETIHVATLPDGSVYDGELQNNKFNGKGKLTRPNGTIYEGGFKSGKMSGHGAIIYPYGGKYVGEFKRGLYHGLGVFYSAGSTYEGEYKNNELIKGTFRNEDGTRYDGEFEGGTFEGEGKLTDFNGDKYHGNFSSGDIHGEGEFFGVDGSHYEGNFNYGSFEGPGIKRFKNGDVYEGEFKYGDFNGKGILTFADRSKQPNKRSGLWRYGKLVSSNNGEKIVTPESLNEVALYNQNDLLSSAWSKVLQNDPAKTELYFLGISGDGTQAVFRREVQYIEKQFARQFLTRDRSVTLINSRDTVDVTPLASKVSIKKTLSQMASKMDTENDILFLYMTSHGSKNGRFSLKQPRLGLPALKAVELRDMLKAIPVKWKVIVISACYSGSFIDPLMDENTLIITAADEKRKSFGCSDSGSFTYFGDAYFNQALNQTSDFIKAFDIARELVEKRETKEGRKQSLPQIHSPGPIARQLAKWRTEVRPN